MATEPAPVLPPAPLHLADPQRSIRNGAAAVGALLGTLLLPGVGTLLGAYLGSMAHRLLPLDELRHRHERALVELLRREGPGLAAGLAERGAVVVSGLARGVDSAAHRGALTAGRTIAVLGSGPDRIYPREHTGLADDIAVAGAVLTEHPPGTAPLPFHFPLRNRLISGLSRGCVVIEAALQSGSLITARLANEQGREVFALPGSIHSPLSKGCHRLIKQGAKLVDDVNDILEEFNFRAASTDDVPARTADRPASTLLELMGYAPCAIDALSARANMTADAVAGALLELELSGLIEKLPGNKYQRIR